METINKILPKPDIRLENNNLFHGVLDGGLGRGVEIQHQGNLALAQTSGLERKHRNSWTAKGIITVKNGLIG